MIILVTGAWKCTDEQLNVLSSIEHEIVVMQDEKSQLPIAAEYVEGIVCNSLFLYHNIEEFKNLKFIQLTSAGFDRVPMEYINKHGIEIQNARGVYSIPMAEFALCGVLQLMKQSRFFARNQESHTWNKHRNLIELSGKTILIIGCGSIGTECAKRFSALGCHTLGVDLFPGANENYEAISPLSDLKKMLPLSDVVILTLPLTEETRHLFDAKCFQKMRDGAILVNIARGAVIDTADLIVTLNSGKLGGAVLDVFEGEPLDRNSQLWDRENVILTPHNSFVGDHNDDRLSVRIMDNISKFTYKDNS